MTTFRLISRLRAVFFRLRFGDEMLRHNSLPTGIDKLITRR